jgi:predicted phosphodiesterase
VRIVAIADTHLFHDDLAVPDGDVLIHAGDMCRSGALAELEVAATWLARLPHRHKIVVAGNHDRALEREPDGARALLAGMHYLEDSGITLDGITFWGSPWTVLFHDWSFMLPRGEPLADRWRRIPDRLDVLVTHGPPEGIGDQTPQGRAGCADLRRRLAEVTPRLHLFGHIHQDGGAWPEGNTLCVNVTTWECERPPTVFDIDATTLTAIAVPPHGRRD